MAHRAVPPFAALHIVSDSKYVVNGLTKWLSKWEREGWIGVSNARLLQELVALLRTRSATTTLRWVKGHAGVEGNEGADVLAKEGAAKPRPYLPMYPPAPQRFLKHGAELASLTQGLAYKAIMQTRKWRPLDATERRVKQTLDAVRDWTGNESTAAALWKSLRRDPMQPKTRDFIWKSLHNAYKIGKFWSPIPGYEQRAKCARCGTDEDMNHILVECTAPGQRELWEEARAILQKCNVHLPPRPTSGLYLGAPLITIQSENRETRSAATRLTRIVLSETAYLIWVLRCERVIEWAEDPTRVHLRLTILNRWYSALNKRLWLDQQRTRRRIPGTRPLAAETVRSTWETVLDSAVDIENDWVQRNGVLVGRRA
ncbi:hypothetical protein C8Q70DRAFT_981825 [Cubamyces menziesii]|nr:hypothetical protein C8Q70DRAFT_981825 [Cubamyces menziesii]